MRRYAAVWTYTTLPMRRIVFQKAEASSLFWCVTWLPVLFIPIVSHAPALPCLSGKCNLLLLFSPDLISKIRTAEKLNWITFFASKKHHELFDSLCEPVHPGIGHVMTWQKRKETFCKIDNHCVEGVFQVQQINWFFEKIDNNLVFRWTNMNNTICYHNTISINKFSDCAPYCGVV